RSRPVTVSPACRRVDSLVQLTSGMYRRLLPNGAYVEFKPNGRHVVTMNRQRKATIFGLAGDTLLTTITLPVPAGGTAPYYQLQYEAVAGLTRLKFIQAPQADSTRSIAVVYAGNTANVRGIGG